MNFDCEIILASNSLRRKELLKLIFENYDIVVSNVDEEKIEAKILKEKVENSEKFSKICKNLAYAKCKKVSDRHSDKLVISADTVVYDDKKIFGKPKNFDDAKTTLEYLSGKTHIVETAVCIFHKGIFHQFSEKSFVTFNILDTVQKELIKSYIENEKPFDKAGSYGIQDRGNLLIKEFKGDFFNIVGLPISSLYRKLYEIQYL